MSIAGWGLFMSENAGQPGLAMEPINPNSFLMPNYLCNKNRVSYSSV